MKRFLSAFAALLVAASALRAAERPLLIDQAQSEVEILVKATLDSFTGRLVAYRPTITVDPERGRVATAMFEFRFEDVKTGKIKRDKDMHEWQNTSAHPDGKFVLTKLEPAGEGNGTETGRLTARGTLTFHGVSRELAFPVAVTTDKTLYAIDGEAGIDTRDFGLPIIRMFGLLKVDPRVTVRFHLQGAVAP